MVSEVFNEDNMIGMARYPDKFFDLAIVDPPYGIGDKLLKGGKTGRVKFHELYEKGNRWDVAPNKEYFSELKRISKNQIIWGGNYFDLPPTRGIVCWDKKKGDVYNFSHWEFAWTSFNCIARLFSKHSHVSGDKIHPTQKPVELYEWLLEKYAKPGNKILDTHMGSQSSRIAAYKMCFDYWGWELDKDYFDAGCKRFAEATAQLKLIA